MTVQTMDVSHTSTTGDPILGVAIEFDGKIWSLPRPNRHHHVIRMIAASNGVGINGPDRQGFYTAKHPFLSRKEALLIAKEHNQLIQKTNPESILFSEDLW